MIVALQAEAQDYVQWQGLDQNLNYSLLIDFVFSLPMRLEHIVDEL